MSSATRSGGTNTQCKAEHDAADASLAPELQSEGTGIEQQLIALGEFVTCQNTAPLCDRADHDEHPMQRLWKDLEDSQQRNEVLERDLVAQKAEHASLINDMVCICEEKQRLFEECEALKLEKELGEWIQQQYHNKEIELKAAAEGKDEDLQRIQSQLDNANAELAQLTSHSLYYEKSLAVGEDVIAELRKRLEATEQELDRQRNCNSFLQSDRNEATQRYILLKSHFSALQEKVAMIDDKSRAELTGGKESQQGRSRRRQRNRLRGAGATM